MARYSATSWLPLSPSTNTTGLRLPIISRSKSSGMPSTSSMVAQSQDAPSKPFSQSFVAATCEAAKSTSCVIKTKRQSARKCSMAFHKGATANVTRNHSLQAAVIRKGLASAMTNSTSNSSFAGARSGAHDSERVQAPCGKRSSGYRMAHLRVSSQRLCVVIIANLAGRPFMKRVN